MMRRKILRSLKALIYLPDRVYNAIQLRIRRVVVGNGLVVNGKLLISGQGEIRIGNSVTINSSLQSNPVGGGVRTALYVGPGAVLEIGNGVGISNAIIYALSQISIGDNVFIGGGTQIYDTDFHAISYSDRVLHGDLNKQTRRVDIDEGAFIGAKSIILKGVRIGARSVIAAGSVVVKDIPANEIWGGNPARFIRQVVD